MVPYASHPVVGRVQGQRFKLAHGSFTAQKWFTNGLKMEHPLWRFLIEAHKTKCQHVLAGGIMLPWEGFDHPECFFFVALRVGNGDAKFVGEYGSICFGATHPALPVPNGPIVAAIEFRNVGQTVKSHPGSVSKRRKEEHACSLHRNFRI